MCLTVVQALGALAHDGHSAHFENSAERPVLGDATAGGVFLHRNDLDRDRGEALGIAIPDTLLRVCTRSNRCAGPWQGNPADGDGRAKERAEQVPAGGRCGFQDRHLCDGSLFEFGERLVRGWYHTGNLRDGLVMVKAESNLDHFLALLILSCMIIAMYLSMEEISHAMGEGALTRLFFWRPHTV